LAWVFSSLSASSPGPWLACLRAISGRAEATAGFGPVFGNAPRRADLPSLTIKMCLIGGGFLFDRFQIACEGIVRNAIGLKELMRWKRFNGAVN
jgi:hypothetical protein